MQHAAAQGHPTAAATSQELGTSPVRAAKKGAGVTLGEPRHMALCREAAGKASPMWDAPWQVQMYMGSDIPRAII